MFEMNTLLLFTLRIYITHQQNSKMSEVITATFHFLGSLIEYSAAAAVPCTKAICMMQAHPGMFGNTSIQPYALSQITFSQVTFKVFMDQQLLSTNIWILLYICTYRARTVNFKSLNSVKI